MVGDGQWGLGLGGGGGGLGGLGWEVVEGKAHCPGDLSAQAVPCGSGHGILHGHPPAWDSTVRSRDL